MAVCYAYNHGLSLPFCDTFHERIQILIRIHSWKVSLRTCAARFILIIEQNVTFI